MAQRPTISLAYAGAIAGLLLSAFLPPAGAQENAVRVTLHGDNLESHVIGAFRSRSVLYLSVTDLAQIMDLEANDDETLRRLEINQPSYHAILTGGSPFLVFLDSRGQKTVLQLPHPVLFAGGSYFVPAEYAPKLLTPLLGRSTAFEHSANTLAVGPTLPASRYDIPTLRIEQKVNGILVRIPASKPLPDYESRLRQDGWLYVTIADASADTAVINALPATGMIRRVVAIQSPTSVQLTFRLTGKASTTEIIRDPSSNDLLLTIHHPGKEVPATGPDLSTQRKRWELDVIVLDAGHGGHDPGTIGVTGVREKDITLGIALKLGRLLKKSVKDVRIVYTRKDDTFVELYRRGQIANEADGKLFVSIHCNSVPRKPHPTRGFEVYLLRPGRTQEAISIAERENAVIELEEGYENRYQELTEENFILVTMAQSAYMRSSEQIADLMQSELERSTGLENRGVKQAGFYVLVGAAMPNVLIEAGYLSNRAEERFLRSDGGQQKIAEAISRAIIRYKKEYEKLLEEGKELGSAEK